MNCNDLFFEIQDWGVEMCKMNKIWVDLVKYKSQFELLFYWINWTVYFYFMNIWTRGREGIEFFLVEQKIILVFFIYLDNI